jgi:cytochrome P450
MVHCGRDAAFAQDYFFQGAGQRSCIGAAFAFTEAQVVPAHLLAHDRVAISDAKRRCRSGR